MTSAINIRTDFPILKNNPELVYLDSASTTLVPEKVISASAKFLSEIAVVSRRGAHHLAVEGGQIVERAREKLASFLNTEPALLSFQKSISSAIASLALGYDWNGKKRERIAVLMSEENSILVTLMRISEIMGLAIDLIEVDGSGSASIESAKDIISQKTGLVAASAVVVGTGAHNPLFDLAAITHEAGALLVCDASRMIGFQPVSISDLSCDIALFSGNLGLMSPPGLTIQWTNEEASQSLLPGIVGSSSVSDVTATSFQIALYPDKFESGTLNIPAIAGLIESIDYLSKMQNSGAYEHLSSISKYLYERLRGLDNIKLYSPENGKNLTIFGLNIQTTDDTINCHDVALFLDDLEIATRSGLLCAHPFVRTLSQDGIIQLSLHIYNTRDDIDHFIEAIETIANELT